MTPDHFQTLALAWLGAISVVGTALVALVVRNWSLISDAIVAIVQLRARINSHDKVAGINTNLIPPPPTTLPPNEKPTA